MSWQQIGDVARDVVDRLYHCNHPSLRIVWTKYNSSGGEFQRPRLRNYCDDCGRILAGDLKHSLANSDTPQLTRDEAMRREQIWHQYQERLDVERKRQEEQRRDDYEAYLQTQEWAERRQRVLKRANGVCEGCGTAPAEQVHHLTYEHCGNEFLWELVAICRHCHLGVHGIESDNE